MTNISEIGRSESRASCITEEEYVPIPRCPSNLRSRPQNPPTPTPADVPTLQPSQESRSTTHTISMPQQAADRPVAMVSGNDSRLQELEQREEKYIRALMQSEQRELDLRNNLTSVQRKLASYQSTLAQQLHERETIKAEVDQRTMAVATPKIFKRFFIRWIQFYNWSQQIKHVQRKRCFIVQHDIFWLWRRKVWLQQELRVCLQKQQHRKCWAHFTEWVNVTRVSVIAQRAGILRETRYLKIVFRAWVDEVTSVKHMKRLQQEHFDGIVRNVQRKCFCEWKRLTRHKTALKKVQELRWQDSLRINKQVVFWSWKLFLFSVARPLREQSARLQRRVQYRQARQHFQKWRKLIEVHKMHDSHLCRRIWRRWVEWRRRVQSKTNAERKANIAVANVYFSVWHATASEQATTRRSLSLAKRYVNRRRLRKLWVHWKYFSMVRRKYTQDSTKALKHYFIKLLRSSWKEWKEQTHSNLQRARASKYGTLQRHFDAFRTGIRLVRAEKARARMLAHARKRQQWSLVRRVLGRWQDHTTRKKRTKRNADVVSRQFKQRPLTTAWRQWRSLHVGSLHRQMLLLRRTYDTVVKEKHELEAHLQAAKDTTVSLADQIEVLRECSKDKEAQVVDLEQRLRLSKDDTAALEGDLKNARSAIERERHAWEDALCEEEEQRDNDSLKYRSLAQENQVLQVQTLDLKRELEAEKLKVVGADKAREDMHSAMESAAQSHRSEVTAALDKQKELEQEILNLRAHLKEQETEREDTANRLQEYEKRIASTCEAMNEHEHAHERENQCLQSEYSGLEARLKEEQVRNAELNRLVQEKNVQLLDMTHRMTLEDCPSRGGHPGHEHCNVPKKILGECAEREARVMKKFCRRHPPKKAVTRTLLAEDVHNATLIVQSNNMSRPRFSAANKVNQLPAERSSPVAPVGSISGSNGPVSPMEVASAEEAMIDEHTSKVHEDIRLLQARISRRLEQVPAFAQLQPRLLQRQRLVFSNDPKSPISSCTSLSEEESDSTSEAQSLSDRMRRARLRRLQTQKAAVITAVSPVVSRLASHPQPSSLKQRERENSALLANTKKRPIRNANSTRLHDRSGPTRRKVIKRQQSAIVGHGGRVL